MIAVTRTGNCPFSAQMTELNPRLYFPKLGTLLEEVAVTIFYVILQI
jgi:hypothetical protein